MQADGCPKPPRLPAADGDEGQITALISIAVIDRLLHKPGDSGSAQEERLEYSADVLQP